jgi:sarcosine oxidase
MCYYEHPDYVPLLRRAYELWSVLEDRAGVERGSLLRITGGVYMGPSGCEAVEGSRRAAEEHGLAHEMLGPRELRARFPQFRMEDEVIGLFEPMAGYLKPERVIDAQLRLARAHGAELRGGCRVLDWSSDGQSVRVHVQTERGAVEFVGQTLIVAAGAWATRVVRDLGVQVIATRQVLGWVRPPRPELFARPSFGVWAIDAAHLGEGLYYGFPMEDRPDAGEPRGAIKLARHAAGTVIDPDRNEWSERQGDDQTFRPCLSRWMPDADGPTEAIRICMYENSPDGHFVIDRHRRYGNVIVAAGFSGHGFKFATVVGEVLADLAMEGRTRHPIGFLGLSRFDGTSRASSRSS